MYAYETLAFDRGSVREKDRNGFLHVKISPLTRVQVAPYYGREIPGFEELGLERDKIYYGYRQLSAYIIDTGVTLHLAHVALRHPQRPFNLVLFVSLHSSPCLFFHVNRVSGF